MTFLALSIALCLAGCTALFENQAVDPIALSIEGGGLKIVVCEDATPDAVVISERLNGEAWSDVWAMDQTVDVARGDDLLQLKESQTDNEPALELELAAGTAIFVRLVDGDENGQTIESAFLIPPEGMPATGWFQADGTTTPQPCE